MTINKKLGLSLVAAAMLSTSAIADLGDINGVYGTPAGTVGTISREKLTVTDVNVSIAAFTFVPKFADPAQRNNPVFEFTFTPGLTAGTDLTGYKVYEINATGGYDENDSVSDTATVSGDLVTFGTKSGSTVKNGLSYAILLDPASGGDGNASEVTNYANILVNVVTEADAAATGVFAKVYTGDTGSLVSEGKATPLYTVENEYAISVSMPFDRRTDLCSGRIVFDTSVGGCGMDNNDTDSVSFEIVRTDMTYDYNASGDVSALTVSGDNNLTAVQANAAPTLSTTNTFGSTALAPVSPSAVTGDATSFTQVNNLQEDSLALASAATVQSLALDYTVDATTVIANTKFGWSFTLAGPEGNTTAAGSASSGALGSAGEWKPYGYAAQIPNVSTTTTGIETTISITNTGAAAQDVFITLVDAGVECSIDSVNNGLAQAAANSTTKYKASDLKAACPSITTNAFGVELDIATTPTDIYTTGSFNNNGVFKDLPVYSTSSMTY